MAATSLFFSYSHKDEHLRDQLEVHLAMLKRQGVIETWHDRRILGGDELDPAISSQIEVADIILLLVSPDFLASKYCYEKELSLAMSRHELGATRVIPVILRPCDWHDTPFGKLKAVPTDGRPITKWADLDDAFLQVTQEIRAAAKSLISEKPVKNTIPSNVKSTEPGPRSSNLRLKKNIHRGRQRSLPGRCL